MRDLLVIVPALNEEASVAQVVTRAREELGADVLVIDDGSTDHTSEKAAASGAIVVRHPFNLGVGAAIRTALRYATAHGYPVVMQMDGDGQHPTSAARLVLAPVLEGRANIVVGSRFAAGYRVGPVRRSMMRLLSRVVSRRLGVTLTDTTSGFRAFDAPAVAYFAQVYPTDYLSDTVEALLLAHDAGLRVQEVAVTMQERTTGQASTNALSSAYYFLRLLLVILLHPFRRR
jgi:glycosyltransferase involved in cell wall biosynthesis